jgi:nitrogenase molybdenum-cofactor synthesis protein NifE
MPWLDINQERYHPYGGYEGMVALVREIDRAIYNPVWQQVRIPAPWGDDGETLGAVTATLQPAAFLADVAAKAMGLAPEEVPS